MKHALFSIMALAFSANAAEPPPFKFQCHTAIQSYVDEVPTEFMAEWDGKILLTSIKMQYGEQLTSKIAPSSSKYLADSPRDEVHAAFKTGEFKRRSYTYTQTFRSKLIANKIRLEHHYATIDSDGFAISTNNSEYTDCEDRMKP